MTRPSSSPSGAKNTRAAKAICAGCVVREECFDYAKNNSTMVGIWGGTSAEQRRKWRRAARAADSSVPESASCAPYDPEIGAWF